MNDPSSTIFKMVSGAHRHHMHLKQRASLNSFRIKTVSSIGFLKSYRICEGILNWQSITEAPKALINQWFEKFHESKTQNVDPLQRSREIRTRTHLVERIIKIFPARIGGVALSDDQPIYSERRTGALN